MSKHTPGTWGYEYEPDGDNHFIWSDSGDRVATAFPFSITTTEANARLIAASPDLLEALQNLIEAAESMKGTYTFVQGKTPEHEDQYGHEKWAEEFLQETTDAARAAIAKATGEQS